ncbi:enolase C-terminal domain-like protein [uncultured Gimesia sp.]|uniref:mandelate racemase/muconate lactonizing enzyme family protein n=1 Tax=uncultured Gimesia sp. TaxID=1678688 RepID=UPI00263313DF|nr:enolase C-terminal domain-like protein [uncultured Gimesia sp.]
MIITEIEAIPVKVPLKPFLTTKTAHGEHVDSPYVIVRIHTNEGLCGLGEATLAPRWSGETSESCLAVINQLIAPALVGEDPLNINVALQKMDRVIKLNPFTKAAVEMALWDLSGKAVGRPVYELLGGKVRDSIPVKTVIGAFSPEKTVELTQYFLDQGFTSLKVKVGLDLESDLERLKIVRQTIGPDVSMGVDANCGWDFSTACAALAQIEKFDLAFCEQPIQIGQHDAWVELRKFTMIPLMADESVFSVGDAWEICRQRSADILSIYPGKNGGISRSVAICHLAEAAGLTCSIGSNLELGIGSAAMLHVAAAMKVINSERFPADCLGPLFHEADLIQQPLSLRPLVATLPTAPGLGVELDEDQLKQWRTDV